jgi:nitrilase
MADTQTFRVAAVQAAPVPFDLAASVAKAIRLINEAAAGGATLLAFPELWLPGYPSFLWMGPPGWALQFLHRYHANSLVVGGPELNQIAEAARRANIDVVVGYSERDHGSLYVGQSFISRDGSIVYSRRKVKPTHVERSLFGEGDGSDLKVAANADGAIIGALNCWEHVQPLLKFAMFAQHEQIHIASWPAFALDEERYFAFSAEACLASSQNYAIEGQCFVLAATAVIDAATLEAFAGAPDLSPFLNPNGGPAGGGAATIFGPNGKRLSTSIPQSEEGIVYADIDLGAITLAKAFADPVGHYARGDVATLIVNRRPRRHARFIDHPAPEAEPEASQAEM